MTQPTPDEFTAMVSQAVAAIPELFRSHLDNVAFLVADEPTDHQLAAGGGGDLLGLYEGIPLPDRGDGYSGVVPDTITVFRGPHLRHAASADALGDEVRQTVWHEVAHYFGLDHDQITRLEDEARVNLNDSDA